MDDAPPHISSVHAAILRRDLETLVRLLDAGGELEAVDTCGRTPLHIAALVGSNSIAGVLLARGASVSAVDSEGRTPLHYVVDPITMQILVNAGVDKSKPDNAGHTAEQVLRSRGERRLAEFLRRALARSDPKHNGGLFP